MLKKEDLESWNSIFTNCNISERELANPTEQFLTKVLCAYLRKFGYKVEYLDMGSEIALEKRLFLIKLVHQIDHILKITHKSYTFTYYDLISPTKKKTSTMLSILLNYLHYSEMYKMDTLPKATERITTWQKLQENARKLEQEIKKNEMDAKKIKEDVADLKTEVAKLKTDVDKQQVEKNQREAELKELKEHLKNFEEKLKTLNSHKRNLKPQVVPNKEVEALKDQIKNFETSVEETKHAIISIEQQIKETNESVRTTQGTIELLNKAKDIIRSKTLDELEEQSMILKAKEAEGSKLEKKKLDLLQQIEQNLKDIKSYEEQINLKREQYDESVAQETACIEQCKKDLMDQNKYLASALEQEELIDKKLQEENSIREFLEENIKKLHLF